MNNDNDNLAVRHKAPWWFWLVSLLFIAWNIIGVSNYLGSVNATAESLIAKEFTLEQAEFMLAMPAYYTAVFALAVWSGLIGAILLLLRKSWAVKVFIFSAFMVVLSFILDVVGGSFKMLGTPYVIVMVIVVLLALFEVWFSAHMKAKGLLN